MNKSRGVVSEKEKLSKLVIELARDCSSLQQLQVKLELAELKPYFRKELLTGVWSGKRKFRLTTLGIGKVHLKEMTRQQKRLDSLSDKRDNVSKDIDYEP